MTVDILYEAIDEVTDDDIEEVMFSFNITQKLSDELGIMSIFSG